MKYSEYQGERTKLTHIREKDRRTEQTYSLELIKSLEGALTVCKNVLNNTSFQKESTYMALFMDLSKMCQTARALRKRK